MIHSLTAKNFMNHTEFSSGEFASVNLFVGINDTGKTGLLKLLYSSTRTVEEYSKKKKNNDVFLKKILAEKLFSVFQPGKRGLGELVSKPKKDKLSVEVLFENKDYSDRLYFTFGETTTTTINDCQDDIKMIPDGFHSLFLPPKEVLTTLKAIRATRDNLFMTDFDDTYLDLIRALSIPSLQGNYAKKLKDFRTDLENLFDGRIVQSEDDEFIFKKGNIEFPVSLTAEGIKKIGILTTLINNRQLNSNSILFIDEPENSLHPHAIRELVKMLYQLASAGVQIFLATHNYFVLKQSYLTCREKNVKTNCYSIERSTGNGISTKNYRLNDYFPENDISIAAIRMADDEIDLELK